MQPLSRLRFAAISCLMSKNRGRGLLLSAVFFALMAGPVWPQNAGAILPAVLTAAQIVEQMQRHNQARSEALKHYQSLRHYKVEYMGFSKELACEMIVEGNFYAVSGKSFRVISESGSKLLCEKVLRRALDSEKEAAQDKGATALTAANYRFELLGAENLGERPAYILHVEPLKPSKFLYRGKIWVDAEDLALAKVDAEPARNPSFWIARTLIRFTNTKTGDFWLPERTQSETKVRIGGTAVLTIIYGTYQVTRQNSQEASIK